MLASHHRDVPECCVRSGSVGAGTLPAFFVNDNRAPRQAPRPAGAAGLVLGREHDDGGHLVATIRILLDDDSYSPPLMVACHADDIIAIWRGLGRDFNLPLLIVNKAGKRLHVTHRPGEVSYARRFGSPLSGRRPRFLKRRATPLATNMQKAIDESHLG